MKGIQSSALCLLASLGTSVQAGRPTEIQLALTQLTGKQCQAELEQTSMVSPGDCVTYRLVVKNIGDNPARFVEISALIPEHTELHTTFRKIDTQEKLGSIIETKANGQRVLKTTLDRLHTDDPNGTILEYSVRVK